MTASIARGRQASMAFAACRHRYDVENSEYKPITNRQIPIISRITPSAFGFQGWTVTVLNPSSPSIFSIVFSPGRLIHSPTPKSNKPSPMKTPMENFVGIEAIVVRAPAAARSFHQCSKSQPFSDFGSKGKFPSIILTMLNEIGPDRHPSRPKLRDVFPASKSLGHL